MKDEFDAKMLGRVGSGQLTEAKSLKRTVHWHEQEMCFSWAGGTRYVTELELFPTKKSHGSFLLLLLPLPLPTQSRFFSTCCAIHACCMIGVVPWRVRVVCQVLASVASSSFVLVTV